MHGERYFLVARTSKIISLKKMRRPLLKIHLNFDSNLPLCLRHSHFVRDCIINCVAKA